MKWWRSSGPRATSWADPSPEKAKAPRPVAGHGAFLWQAERKKALPGFAGKAFSVRCRGELLLAGQVLVQLALLLLDDFVDAGSFQFGVKLVQGLVGV